MNFANRESTQASWQLDDVYDPMTGGNFQRTEVTQTKDEWRAVEHNQPIVPKCLSNINSSKLLHDPTAPNKLNQSR